MNEINQLNICKSGFFFFARNLVGGWLFTRKYLTGGNLKLLVIYGVIFTITP